MTTATNPHRGFRYPAEVIEHAFWLYHCFSLSLRDVKLILAARGVVAPTLPSSLPVGHEVALAPGAAAVLASVARRRLLRLVNNQVLGFHDWERS